MKKGKLTATEVRLTHLEDELNQISKTLEKTNSLMLQLVADKEKLEKQYHQKFQSEVEMLRNQFPESAERLSEHEQKINKLKLEARRNWEEDLITLERFLNGEDLLDE